VACLLAALLLAGQTARAVLAVTRERRLAATSAGSGSFEEEIVAGGATAASQAAGANAVEALRSGAGGVPRDVEPESAQAEGILKLLPAESQPGPLLSDLFAILEAAGVDTYRYRLLLGEAVQPGAEPMGPPLGDQPIAALLAAPAEAEETEAGALAELAPLDLEETQLPPPPPGVRAWHLALQVRASYARVLAALRALEADERVWDVQRAVLHDAEEGTEAAFRLTTYTRAGSVAPAGSPSRPTASEDAPLRAPVSDEAPSRAAVDDAPARTRAADDPQADPSPLGAVRTWAPLPAESSRIPADPFRAGPGAAPRALNRPASPPLPRLGAIRTGSGAAAWLDGRAVRVGGRSGSWTVIGVEPGEVRLRHDDGTSARLRLGGGADAPRETSDEGR